MSLAKASFSLLYVKRWDEKFKRSLWIAFSSLGVAIVVAEPDRKSEVGGLTKATMMSL